MNKSCHVIHGAELFCQTSRGIASPENGILIHIMYNHIGKRTALSKRAAMCIRNNDFAKHDQLGVTLGVMDSKLMSPLTEMTVEI
jgi:hypothetical protein